MATKEEEDKKKKTALIIIPIFGLGALLYFLFRRRPPTPPPDKAALYGFVVDAQTGNGISGIDISLNGYAGISDNSGYYVIEDIEPGSYTLIFTDPLGRYEPVTV